MAANYSNNNSQNNNSPTIYSPYRMNNGESKIDPTCLTFTYWNNSVKLTIAPKKPNTGDEMQFDFDAGVVIYLNHTKARMLANEIKLFMSDPVKYNSSGVVCGSTLVTISNGVEFGCEGPCLVIRKVDEFGNIVGSFTYEFKRDYYYTVRNYVANDAGGDYTKVFDEYNNLEIEQLITLLEEYYKAATNAIAFTVIDQNKYNYNKMMGRLSSIAAKLGIEEGSQKSNTQYKSNSYFNNNGNSAGGRNYSNTPLPGFAPATLDDLDDD